MKYRIQLPISIDLYARDPYPPTIIIPPQF